MTAPKKIRLDQLLVERRLFPSRSRAQAAIMAGVVIVDNRNDRKAGDRVAHDIIIDIKESDCPYASRGGLKLAGALDYFRLDPRGMNCLDIGASTGGFTDCLLQRGADHVTALDVGKGLIAWSLRNHPSVTLIEKTNARIMNDDVASGPFDLIVMDVSFISIKLILPKLPRRMSTNGIILSLIKPQFEAGRENVPKGVVKNPDTWREVLESVITPDIFSSEIVPTLLGFTASPITGKEGNREFFGMWKMGASPIQSGKITEQIEKIIEIKT